MIILCKQCKTKFRFDDSLMEGDGLWMRCCRCQHVFFQDNPGPAKPAGDTAELIAGKAASETTEKTVRRPSFEPAPVSVGGSHDEDMQSFMKEVIGEEKTADAAAGAYAETQTAVRPRKGDEKHSTDIDLDGEGGLPEEAGPELADASEEPARPPRKKSVAWKVALWAVLVIVVIPAVVYFVIFPDLGERYVQIARKYIGWSSQPADGQVVMGQIKLQNIRQRIANNLILGNIRIVEGTAVNQADFPVSRIQVKGEILDAYAVVLGERVSYAGNVLTEEELVNLSEEDISKRLSRPEGRNNINEKVLPNGHIPFMIVFTREPAGSIKTTVMVTRAERLL